jgi:hypothetical protein
MPKGPPPPVTELSPQVPVDELPNDDGKYTGQSVGPGEGGGWLNRVGSWETLTGTLGSTIGDWQDIIGDNASMVLTVDEGRVRGYLKNESDKKKGYHYVEATPGHPAQTRGYLMYGGGKLYIKLQAVDGVAKGVRYHVWGGKH